MIKVIIADDQKIIREGLKFIIEQDKDIEVLGFAGNGKEAFEQCKALVPDVVLMDIMMPDCNGVEGTKLIKEEMSNIKVIILTTFRDDENISAALRNGADGYVLKDIDTDELILTIKSVFKGLHVIHDNAFGVVKGKISDNVINEKTGKTEKTEKSTVPLTQREVEIVRLIVYGKSNKEIAASLFLSEGSVRNMVSSILMKLEFKDRTQLAVYAVKNDLI